MQNSSNESGSSRPELVDGDGKPLVGKDGNPVAAHAIAAPRVPGDDFQDRNYEPPTGSPCPPPTPTGGKPELILAYLDDLVENEAVLLEKCQRHCTGIIKRAFDAGAYGMDLMGEAAAAVTQMNMVAAATPLAVELYREILKSLNGPRLAEFKKVCDEANPPGTPAGS